MRVWHYDPDNGVLLGFSEADVSPLEPDVFVIPAFATELTPPEHASYEALVFKDGGWLIVDRAILPPLNTRITSAPSTLFGGPTMQELFNVG